MVIKSVPQQINISFATILNNLFQKCFIWKPYFNLVICMDEKIKPPNSNPGQLQIPIQ